MSKRLSVCHEHCREEPKEPYIMFADPKPYLVRLKKKKAPWEQVEEDLERKSAPR